MTEEPDVAAYTIRRRDARRRLDASAPEAADAEFLLGRIRAELLSRLDLVTIEPRLILDAGAGSGPASRELRRRFRRCRLVSADLSPRRLALARASRSRFARNHEVVADATRLPFRTRSFDMLFANMLLPWISETEAVAGEFARVLRPEGLLAFSSLGPDSFRELREAWREVDDQPHVAAFPDMHDVGDALVRAGLLDPVLDVETIRVTYRDIGSLWRDLTAAGARNSLAGRSRGLTAPARIRALQQACEHRVEDGQLAVTLELVYGHAWGGSGRPRADADGIVRIDPGSISGRR